jgi:pimeloyl-ACP methyl ester carboxylesterase
MHPLLGLIQLLAVGFVVGLGALIVYTAWLLVHPHRRSYAWAVARGQPGDPGELDEPLQFESREIDSTLGVIPIWDIQGRDPNGPIVLMTHGWGSSRQGALKRIPGLIDHASRIIAWDLPGHGEAAGIARLGTNEYNAGLAILESLDALEHGIVLMGWSMGAGISLDLCVHAQDRFPITGVICEAVYAQAITPARGVLALRGMPHRLSLGAAIGLLGMKLGVGAKWNGFDRVEIARKVRVPVLLIHGDQDPVSPIEDSRAIDAAAPSTTLYTVVGAGHNNLWSDEVYRGQVVGEVESFMERCRSPRSHSGAHAQP